jgi:hypothetical protein
VLKRTDAGSLMPANLVDPLAEQEQLDLYKFLSQLGKPGAFDATKSRAPRVWAVMPATAETLQAGPAGDPAAAWVPVTGTLNGRLLASDAALFTGNAEEIFAATRLQLAEARAIQLDFPQAPVALWIDGAAVQPGTEIPLSAGIHTIVVRHATAAGDLRFESEQGTFLPAW